MLPTFAHSGYSGLHPTFLSASNKLSVLIAVSIRLAHCCRIAYCADGSLRRNSSNVSASYSSSAIAWYRWVHSIQYGSVVGAPQAKQLPRASPSATLAGGVADSNVTVSVLGSILTRPIVTHPQRWPHGAPLTLYQHRFCSSLNFGL